jgi:L-fucono-1,5-lactonase
VKIDTHQHFWNLTEAVYPWLNVSHGPLLRTFEAQELEPQVKAAGIDKTVLVQAANSYEDTVYMLKTADTTPWVGAVVGWVNLLNPDETDARLSKYKNHPKFRGVRHLIHDEPDPDWIMQDNVIQSLKVLAEYKLTFDLVGVFPNHLKHVPALCERIPNLRLVIDHLAKPPIKEKKMSPWTDQLKAASQFPNVYAKISGLNTAANWATWNANDLKPYVDFAIECFGAGRCMFGSDWPVCLLAGDYNQVWMETNKVLEGRSQSEQDAILGGTAKMFYRL